MKTISLRILETADELQPVEDLQRQVWPGTETDLVPIHMLLAVIHNGGLVVGAYEIEESDDHQEGDSSIEVESLEPVHSPVDAPLVGFVFGFPGLYQTADGPRIKHHSHMLAVLPGHRDQGIGFMLKRAQWQMVRHQGLDRITWTYDPLMSRNAHLNLSRLGAVCNTYIPNFYGEMRDGLNLGLPSDRFQVDWWVNSGRVLRRLSKRPRLKLDLAHFLAAGTAIINPSTMDERGLPRPVESPESIKLPEPSSTDEQSLLLVEIPADFLALKQVDQALALEWRLHTRALFVNLFAGGYLITDFIHLPGTYPRSFYVLSYGESTL
jgi:predicted GNAT superfamily acetyltransferase